MTEPGTGKRLDELPGRLDDLRIETHRGFDGVETDIRELRSEMNGLGSELRSEMKDLRSEMKADLHSLHQTVDSLQKLMVRFFATTLGSIIAAVIVMVLTQR